MRERPAWITEEFWKEFEKFADLDGIGTHEDDWLPWLMCWIDGVRVQRRLSLK